jgi:putative SOS response-associated peptidase YedK
MCGRIDLHTPAEEIARHFRTAVGLDAEQAPPGWNIAPARKILAVIGAGGAPELVGLTWGFVPHWARDLDGPKPINARSDTVFDKPMFRDAVRRRRCLVPVDGFYEWQRAGARKQPYYFRLADGRPFALGGIWSVWSERRGEQEGYTLHTCAILTTAANALMAPVHDRMPVIVAAEHYARWLSEAVHGQRELAPLFAPCDPRSMEAWPVSNRVNRAANDGPDLIEAVAPIER